MNRTQLLVHVAEEANEVAQRATKALRFGLDEVQEGQDLTNAERIRQECLDLQVVLQMVAETAGNPGMFATTNAEYDRYDREKRARVERYLTLSATQGVLDLR